ncbi:MAG: hypothetical protein GY769_17065 [bacterium]|nr:hypothetical protein [bacterium]
MAIWGTESLLGRELKDTLAQRRDLWDDLRLLGRDPDSSTVSEIAGEAVLIQPGTEENLSDVDILYVCGEPGEPMDIPAGLPEHATTIILAGDEPIDGFPAVVAGVNSDVLARAGQAATLLSAHPAAVALAQLLKPLADLGLESCTASVLLPSSTKGQEGIDELLAQTRSILAFQPRPEELFGCQLAFNIAPSSFPGGKIAETVREVLGDDKIRVAVQASIGGVFHSLLVGAHVRLAAPADEAAVRQALEASPSLEFAERPETLGPVDAAGSSSLHLGAIEASTAPNSFWLRAVMDNLTAGGALNAIRIAEAVLESDGYTM